MPSFLWTIVFFCIFLWSCFGYILVWLAPTSFSTIIGFLGVFFLATSFTLSLPLFFLIRAKSYHAVTNTRTIYRRALAWGGFGSFGVTGLFTLRAFDIFNILNGGLFCLLYIGIYFYLKDITKVHTH